MRLKRTRGITEHALTARWTSVEGDKVTIRRGNGIDTGKGMTIEVFWRLMALWEGNERDGAAFAEAACACLDTLQPGAARTGRSARKEEMCWATPQNLQWIFVEELAIEGELTCDLLNLFEGFKKWFTWEDLPLFTGNGRVQRDGLTTQAFNSVRYGYANPEYNGGDVGHGEVDDHVMRTIRLAAASVKDRNGGRAAFCAGYPTFRKGQRRVPQGGFSDGRTDTTGMPTRHNGIHPRQSLERRRQSENG